jgi:shikimate kinase
MPRVLITGMSGTGKTTLLDELRRRGHVTLDTDYDGWVLADRRWDEPRMTMFLRDQPDVFVAGTVENQGTFYHRFDHVVLLSVPRVVLIERIGRRTNNPYGQAPEQLAEIEHYLATVEPLLRQGASVELDGRRPTSELADLVEARCGSARP